VAPVGPDPGNYARGVTHIKDLHFEAKPDGPDAAFAHRLQESSTIARRDLADGHLGFSAGENTTDNRWTTLYDGIPQAHGQPPALPPGVSRLYATAPPTDRLGPLRRRGET
jgi:hypothetical protein